jgi:photosystem II stability/assembly factor-like uncharacterized protein
MQIARDRFTSHSRDGSMAKTSIRTGTYALAATCLALGVAGADLVAQPAARAAHGSFDPQVLDGMTYRYVGPTRGGRVTAVAGHASQPETYYFGGTGGGVFRTDDAGLSWRPITDGQIPVGSIGAIKVAPSNAEVIYVGTGSAAIRSNVSIGKGMYKSVDGGKTWRPSGLEKVGVIADMVVHPTNADIVFVAAVGNPFGRNPERGIFRTTDGGRSWQKVLFVSDSTGASDIAMNPANPNELYAGMWRGERKPWTVISGAREGGIYKSTDGGTRWVKLTNGLPNEYTGKISVSVSPANPQRVYALMEAGDGTLGMPGGVHGGVYRSDDAGATWTRTSSQAGLINRPFYYTYIDADPKVADVVYVNNEGFFKSMDGGRTFERRPTPHGDNHGMWINPNDPDIFIQSNDGGVNVTKDGGRTWTTQNNQPTAELYQVDLDDRWPYWIYAGQQDNTTIGVPSTGEAARPNNPSGWRTNIGGCETGPAVPQPGTEATIFFSNCKGRFYRYSELTGQSTEYSVGAANMYGHNPKDLKYRFQRVAPIVISPHDPNVVYHTSQYVHRTTDGGRTWQTISPDLTANDPRGHVISGTPITRDITGEEFYSTLYAIAESPLERGVIWTGSNDGPIHITRNNGAEWTSIAPRGLPGGGRVQTVEASPHRRGSAYIAVLRYMFDDWKPYIYRTDDYGRTWTHLTGPSSGFPQDHPTRVIREDPAREGLLYAGTEFGMFVSFDNGRTWSPFQQNLPATVVSDFKVYRNDLVVATQGRGFWVMDDLSPLHEVEKLGTAPHVVRPQAVYRGGGRGADATFTYYLPRTAPGAVSLDILDADGAVIRTLTADGGSAARGGAARDMPGEEDSPASRFVQGSQTRPTKNQGLNHATWDLRRDGNLAVSPGRYTLRLNVEGESAVSVPFEVQLHPRLVADGITAADLQAQYELAAKVQQLAAEGRAVQAELRAARERHAGNAAALARLDALDAQVNTQSGQAYAQPMLISQIGYLNGIVTRGDNRPHRDAFERYEELRAQLDDIRSQLAAIR